MAGIDIGKLVGAMRGGDDAGPGTIRHHEAGRAGITAAVRGIHADDARPTLDRHVLVASEPADPDRYARDRREFRLERWDGEQAGIGVVDHDDEFAGPGVRAHRRRVRQGGANLRLVLDDRGDDFLARRAGARAEDDRYGRTVGDDILVGDRLRSRQQHDDAIAGAVLDRDTGESLPELLGESIGGRDRLLLHEQPVDRLVDGHAALPGIFGGILRQRLVRRLDARRVLDDLRGGRIRGHGRHLRDSGARRAAGNLRGGGKGGGGKGARPDRTSAPAAATS